MCFRPAPAPRPERRITRDSRAKAAEPAGPIEERTGEQKEEQGRERLEVWYPDYLVLTGEYGQWLVSCEAATQLERALDRRRPPRDWDINY